MNQREKELYLREYSLLKAQGKPFFPYAVAKDSLMACVVLFAIIMMSLIFGAELGPKADPTTTTYVPRPEWYFFFLFELLRVLKPPELVPIAMVGIPTVAMVLLLLLPFYDRGAERHQRRRLDDPQQLEEEEEVPLRARRVRRRRRVGLRAQLGAEDDRHRDDHGQDDRRHDGVLGHGVREERFALRLQQRVIAEVELLLALVHASTFLSSSGSSALSHGGAVVPSLATR